MRLTDAPKRFRHREGNLKLEKFDPLEKRLIEYLAAHDIEFTRPEATPSDPTNLDFYLPVLDLYIEVKQFHTDRIAKQLARVPIGKTVILLQGTRAIDDFKQLVWTLAGTRPHGNGWHL